MRKKDEMEKSERERKKTETERERMKKGRACSVSGVEYLLVCKIMRVKIHPMYFCFGKGINSNLVYKRSQFMLPAFRKKFPLST
jgi:hypothetical protein